MTPNDEDAPATVSFPPATAELRGVTPLRPRQIFTVLCATFATAVYAFTWNSVTVALPHMQGRFSATTDQIAWVMIAFIIGSAATTASIGWVSDRFGRRPVFLWAIVGYSLTLAGCGAATTLEEEVAWRFAQGVFGAALLPLGQIIAVNAFPAERYVQATALWALGFVSANVFAPAVAGLIVEEFGWPWIFYLPIPVSVAVFVASWVLVPDAPKNERPMPWTGFLGLIIGVSFLQLALARGERLDWFESTEIVIEAAVALVGLYVFVAHSIASRRPFFSRRLFINRDFVTGQVFSFVVGGVMFLPMLLLPLMLQQVAGYSAADTGYLLLSRGVGSMLGLLAVSIIRGRGDPRLILLFGLAISAYATWSMAQWTVAVRPWDVIWTSFLHGLAAGPIFTPLNSLTLSRLRGRVQDQGFAFFYLSFDVGSAIGTAAIVGAHARLSQINHSVLAEHISPLSETLRHANRSGTWSLTDPGGLAALQGEVSRQAAMIAYNDSFLIVALALAAMIPLILLFRYRRRARARA